MLSRFICFFITCALLCLCLNFPVSAAEETENIAANDPNMPLQLPTVDSQQSDLLYNVLVINYVALNTMDLVTTFKSIDKGAVELNPIARPFIDRRPMAIAFKAGITGGVLFALDKMKQRDRRAAFITLGVLNVVYGIVVANNIGVYLQLN